VSRLDQVLFGARARRTGNLERSLRVADVRQCDQRCKVTDAYLARDLIGRIGGEAAPSIARHRLIARHLVPF